MAAGRTRMTGIPLRRPPWHASCTTGVLKEAKTHGVPQVMHTGTGKEYGGTHMKVKTQVKAGLPMLMGGGSQD